MNLWEPKEFERLTANIPHLPGVYLMRDKKGKVIYIGKAIDLHNRVSSYFHASGDNRPFISILSSVLNHIDTVVTANEKEALILEAELIRKHKPVFNILLKDDKHFLFLRIDPSEEFPRLTLTRRRKDDNSLYFGPYHSAQAIRTTYGLITRYFGLRTCSDREMKNRSRPCLEYQMHRCIAPCVKHDVKDEYQKRVETTVMFLKGRYTELTKLLEKQMVDYANQEKFEEAARIRDQIRAIDAVLTRQSVVLPVMKDVDAVGYARSGDCLVFAVMRFEEGVLLERCPYTLEGVVAPDEDIFESFLMQFYNRAPLPDLLLLHPEMPCNTNVLEEVLRLKGRKTFRIKKPAKGLEMDAVHMAMQNAQILLEQFLISNSVPTHALMKLAEIMRMPHPPKRIEGYDMSNIQGADPVGAMVVFTDGRPDKKAYRYFSIRGGGNTGDLGYIREVIKRRFKGSLSANPLPDLILIDGGELQVNAVSQVLSEIGITTIPIVGLAKSRVIGEKTGPADHSPERLYMFSGVHGVRDEQGHIQTFIPPQDHPGLHLLMRVRDEAHRFANTFHRKKRTKKGFSSILDNIPGLGNKRRTLILRHFGSLKAIQDATAEEIISLGIPKKVAHSIIEKMRGHL